MKLLSSRPRLYCALPVSCFLVLPLLLPAVFSSGAANPTQQTPAVKAQAPVSQRLTVTVLDRRGLFVAGLTKEEFAVTEGKTEHELGYFNAEDTPASIALLVDVSKSVEPRAIDAARYAAVRFMQESHPENEYFIGEFSNSLRGLTDWTRDARTIVEGLNRLATGSGAKQKPKGQTALYDSCIAGLEKMARGAHSKRVLLLISDGGSDTDSRYTFDDLKRKIRESGVLIYAINLIAFGSREPAEGKVYDFAGQATGDELASLSGGRAYFVENKIELDEVVERIAVELRQQYVIGFTPTDSTRGGKWNKVKIKVTPRNKSFKGVFVRSREGYFSPPASP